MKIILGSGIVALLANKFIPGEKLLIPFKRSRFYTYNPPLDENYIITSSKIEEAVRDIGASRSVKHSRAFSIAGQLIFKDTPVASDPFASKVFGPEELRNPKMDCSIYDITARDVYMQLEQENLEEIKQFPVKYGDLINIDIDNHLVNTTESSIEYESLISCIPLYSLMELCGKEVNCQSRDVWYYHIITNNLDFEGADEVLVADPEIDFYRVTQVTKSPNSYLFECLKEILTPVPYFSAFLPDKFMLYNTTVVPNVIPSNQVSTLKLENENVYCIGKTAQWDNFMDLSSCINRIIRVGQR